MSAFGRLWSRAPLWRRTVFVTAAAVALTIAYPPAWLEDHGIGQSPREMPAPVAVGQGPAVPSRPEPAPIVQANDPGIPAAGTFYAGHLPLGEQSVPLPPGRWLALAVASPTAADAPRSVNVFLALVLGGRINAAAVIGGSVAPDPHDAGFAAPLEAQIPPYYYRRVLSAADHGAMDFWLVGSSQPARWTDPLRQAAVNVIRQQGLVFADRLDSAVFRFADKRNWVTADFMFPDTTTNTDQVRPWTEVAAVSDTALLSQPEKVRRWGKAWHEIMRRGFAGTLRPGDEAHIAPP